MSDLHKLPAEINMCAMEYSLRKDGNIMLTVTMGILYSRVRSYAKYMLKCVFPWEYYAQVCVPMGILSYHVCSYGNIMLSCVFLWEYYVQVFFHVNMMLTCVFLWGYYAQVSVPRPGIS